MPTKLILFALIFGLIALYIVIATDMYVLPAKSREDVMTSLQSMKGQPADREMRNVLIGMQSGERMAASADTSVVFGLAVPITLYYTPILHKPLGADFAQDGTIQHIDALYLSRSYPIYFALFVLATIQVGGLLRWSKGRSIKEVYFYACAVLFACLLGFQYFR